MRAAVIPTHSRPSDFADCVAAIRPQVDLVVAVAHGRMAAEYAGRTAGVDRIEKWASQTPNISSMWRLGLDAAREQGAQWVAVLNDDAVVSRNWFAALQTESERLHAAGASGERGPGSKKIAGFAFILDATSGVKPDERFSWWYSDDAIQKRCEAESGFAILPSATVEHRYPNKTTTGRLRQVARADRPRFQRAYR